MLILYNKAHQYYDSGIDALLLDRNKVFTIRPFFAMAMIKQVCHCSFGLTKTFNLCCLCCQSSSIS